MRKICALLALAGTAAFASAQYTMEWNWDGPSQLTPDNPTGTYTLWATWGGPSAEAYAGSIFDVMLDGWEICPSFISNGMINPALAAFAPHDGIQVDDGNILGIDSFQLPEFFNPPIDKSNPIWVYTLDVTATGFNGHTMTLISQNHLNHSIYTDAFGTSVEATPTINGLDITCIPAPGALALLGLGGLVAARRRR